MSFSFKLESVSLLNELFQQAPPSHPLISIIDFSTVDFQKLADLSKQQVSMGLYCILLKKLNRGSLKYGRNHYDFQEGSLFFMSPDEIVNLQSPELDECDYNWGLFFHPDLIKGTSLFRGIRAYSFFTYKADEVLHLSEDEKSDLTEVLNSINKEVGRQIDKHTKSVLNSGIELLLNQCMRFYDRQFVTRSSSNNEKVRQLKTFLANYFASDRPLRHGLPTVKLCAAELALSPNYLTDLLKKETGKTTKEHIDYYVLEVAKDLLLSSNKPISQVAYSLGYEYPQYFTKLFKKKTGMAPTAYRNNN